MTDVDLFYYYLFTHYCKRRTKESDLIAENDDCGVMKPTISLSLCPHLGIKVGSSDKFPVFERKKSQKKNHDMMKKKMAFNSS